MQVENSSASLDIVGNGIVHRAEDGTVILVRPAANGSAPTLVEVDRSMADRFALSTGDIVDGMTRAIPEVERAIEAVVDDGEDYDERDEPAAVGGETVPEWLITRTSPTETLVDIRRINGLTMDRATERPAPREKRGSYERIIQDKRVELAVESGDMTGRMLDFAAPFGLGFAGLVHGPHGAGLTRTLQSVARGISHHAPESVLIILLIRARGEEITDWRRRFPGAEVVVCPWGRHSHGAEETLRVADLTLATAQRQTELGRHVVLLVDSLTGLWGAMLEGESADAQREADRAVSRHRIREWIQAAGDFGGEGLLGSGLGGSLTIIGTAWSQPIDSEAEEEGESHPHLRLIEHILTEVGWRAELSGGLSADRLFPAIRTSHCQSRHEDRLIPTGRLEKLRAARSALADLDDRGRHMALANAIDATTTFEQLLDAVVS